MPNHKTPAPIRKIQVTHYEEVPVSIDAVALRVAIEYVEREYGKAVLITGITSFPNGSVRLYGTTYSTPSGVGPVEFSAFGTGAGEAGE